jgi:hypothetical protein
MTAATSARLTPDAPLASLVTTAAPSLEGRQSVVGSPEIPGGTGAELAHLPGGRP